MNIQDLINHYGVKNKSQLAIKLKVGRSTMTEWEDNGIPPQIQATFEVQTNGVLKADRSALNLRFKTFRDSETKPQALTA
ncbi:helix-turn-helix domain-containing protein [Acinetobacter sp. YH12045]|uniref:helix-turn-helix domain-containing protein n=1 Tax=Acinetobacter sp. YH12045 TaxID=2601051 RepID=UPI0015D2F5FB|nr:helix-turn-helix domain-containing protein [Acinetobacter sp. YH12045]